MIFSYYKSFMGVPAGYKRKVWKKFLILFLPLTVINVAAFFLINILFLNAEQQRQQTKIMAVIDIGAQLAQHDFETTISHLEFLANSGYTKNYIHHESAQNRQFVEQEFLNLQLTSPLYDQVRLLSADGMELIRVDSNQGDPVVVPSALLQNKSSRYYFQETAQITDGKIYISPLDLNMENGEIELPHKPMIRFGKPLFDEKGQLSGVVILNYFGKHFLDSFRKQMELAPGDGALINQQGFWLSNSDPKLEWGFMLDHKNSFSLRYPEVWKKIKTMDNGVVNWQRNLFSFAKVHPVSDFKKRVVAKDNFFESWQIIIQNPLWNASFSLFLSKVQFLSHILIMYPIGLVLIFIWARASTGKKIAELKLKRLNHSLERRVVARTQELEATKNITIMSMARLAETRDNETGMHLQRTQEYVRLLAKELQRHGCFAESLNEKTINLLAKSAPLHDIGKVGVPDHILHKPGKLTAEEFEIMKRHATYGGEAIESSIATLKEQLHQNRGTTFLQFAQEIAHYHHEKWDGSGYPAGLSEDNIPLSARIMAIADVFDALSSDRVYKKAFDKQTTEKIIIEGRGNHFDPRVVDAFIQVKEQFWEIKMKFSDVVQQSNDEKITKNQSDSQEGDVISIDKEMLLT